MPCMMATSSARLSVLRSCSRTTSHLSIPLSTLHRHLEVLRQQRSRMFCFEFDGIGACSRSRHEKLFVTHTCSLHPSFTCPTHFHLVVKSIVQVHQAAMSQTSTISLDTIAPISSHIAPISHDDRGPESPSLQLQQELDQQLATDASNELSKGRAFTIIATITGITTVSSFSTGLLVIYLFALLFYPKGQSYEVVIGHISFLGIS